MTNCYTMNVSCKEALAHFNTDYVMYTEILGKVYIQMINYPVVGQTAKVSRKNGNCCVFGITSDNINDKNYYEMVKVNHNWFRLDQINFDDIVYGETAFISASLYYDTEEKNKKINVSAFATKEIFGEYNYVERVNVGKQVHFILRNSKVNKNTTKICNKSGGSTFNMVNKTLQKGSYYIMERNGDHVSFRKTSKKFVKENKGNIAYCSVSR